MCSGWNQPPDLFSISQTSDLVGPHHREHVLVAAVDDVVPGLAVDWFHSLVMSLRSTRRLRPPVDIFSVRPMASLATSVEGMELMLRLSAPSGGSAESSTTSNAMILLVWS